MRKTSQDGGDSTSMTSCVENEFKKSGTAITKPKGNSIKRKVQNFSRDSDDAVIEPLLKKDNDQMENTTQSVKYLVTKIKTNSPNEKESDKEKLLTDETMANTQESTIPVNENITTQSYIGANTTTTAPIHNYMNTNVFNNHLSTKGIVASKIQILVEIDGSKPPTYSPSPLIFTTAKIHANGTTKLMEPVQVTSVPIFSTTEESVLKITSGPTNENKNNGKSMDNAIRIHPNGKKSIEKEDKASAPVLTHSITPLSLSKELKVIKSTPFDNKANNISDKTTPCNATSANDLIHPVIAIVQMPTNNVEDKMAINSNSKISKDDSVMKMSQSQSICSNPDNIKILIPANTSKTIDSDTNNVIQTSKKAKAKQSSRMFDCIKDQENKVDLKNVQAYSGCKDLQSISNIKLFVNTKGETKKEIPPKPTNNSIGNKQLQRQKNATTDDMGVLGSKPTSSNVDPTTNSNVKIPKDPSLKLISASKVTALSKIPDYELSKVCDNKSSMFKPSANNFIVATKTNPEITATSSTSKISLLNTLPSIKSTLTDVISPNTVTMPSIKGTKPSSTNIPLNSVKIQSSTTIKPPKNAETTGLKSETKLSEAIPNSNMSLTTSTMKSLPPTSTTLAKMSTVSTMISPESHATVPINVAVKKSKTSSLTTTQTLMTTQTATLGKYSVNSTSCSSVSANTAKPSARQMDSAPISLNKSSGSSNIIPTTTTTDSAGKPSLLNKNSGKKTCDLNNEDKGLKA